jgi:hypothetical protein
MPKYAPIPLFGQIVEYVTQVAPDGNGYCDVQINTVPLSAFDLAGVASDAVTNIQNVFADFAKVLQARAMDLSGATYIVVIPAGIRLQLNQWLAAQGFATANVTSTYAQVLAAMRSKLTS